MKILLVSDIHLGVKQNSELFIYNTKDFFLKQILSSIKENNIDQLWILGDLFDCRNTTNVLVNNVALNIMATILSTYQNLQIKILCGNHDAYYKNTLEVSSLKIFKRFHKNLEVITSIKEYNLDGCLTLVVPWLAKESKNYNDFLKICDEPKKFELCLGHFEINGFEIIKGVIEKSGLNKEMFKCFDDVFSGHFHLHKKHDNIQYLGCPYEITWNDYGDPKGFTIFDTKTKNAIFHENTISPKHKIIKLSSVIIDETLLNDVKGNFVKFYIDKPLSTNEHIEWVSKLEKFSPLKYDIINEFENSNNENGEQIEISSIEGDAISLIDEYNKQNPLPTNINEDEFKLYIKKLHDESMKDND